MAKGLGDLNVEKSMIPQLAEEAAAQWTARFNPVAVDASMLEAVYRAAW